MVAGSEVLLPVLDSTLDDPDVFDRWTSHGWAVDNVDRSVDIRGRTTHTPSTDVVYVLLTRSLLAADTLCGAHMTSFA